MGSGVTVQSYSSDNGIYTSKDFTREMHGNFQGIKHSGVGVKNHNGVAQNANNNLVRLARTTMIHTALRWYDAIQKSLCTIDIAHSVHVHNHTTHISSVLYPEELCTSYKFSHSYLHNFHPWVCPAYVFGKKIPVQEQVDQVYVKVQERSIFGSLPSIFHHSGTGQ